MRSFLLVLSLGILVLGGVFFSYWQRDFQEKEIVNRRQSLLALSGSSEQKSEEKNIFRADFSVLPPDQVTSHLTGEKIASPSHAREFVLGVMIDNATIARMGQVGLEDASVVIEAFAEGGITRFLALFSSYQNISEIGPVRSARPYFYDFLRPLHGILVHAGGSDQVLAELASQGDVFDIDNEHISDGTFWRKNRLNKPHNLFTNTKYIFDHLLSAKETNGLSPLDSPLFHFGAPVGNEKVAQIITDFSYPAYRTVWTWDEAKQSFQRFQSRSTLDINVENLVMMEADMWRIADDPKGRMAMKNTGNGKIMAFQDGKMTLGTWQKSSRSEALEFFDAEGSTLPFVRGKTWITIIDDFDKVSAQ